MTDGIKQFLLRLAPEEVLVTTHGEPIQLRKRLIEALDDGIVVTSNNDGLIVIPYTAIRYLEIPR